MPHPALAPYSRTDDGRRPPPPLASAPAPAPAPSPPTPSPPADATAAVFFRSGTASRTSRSTRVTPACTGAARATRYAATSERARKEGARSCARRSEHQGEERVVGWWGGEQSWLWSVLLCGVRNKGASELLQTVRRTSGRGGAEMVWNDKAWNNVPVGGRRGHRVQEEQQVVGAAAQRR